MQLDNPEQEGVRVARMIEPPPPRPPLPWATWSLAGVNILIALVQFALGGFQFRMGELTGEPIHWALGAKVPSLIAHGEYWRLVTANFLHGSWLHLAFNVFSLVLIGRLIETFYGPARTLVIYVFSCVAGAALSYHFSFSVSLGASTGVMGLLGALLVHNRKYQAYLPPRINRVFPMLLFIVLMQFVLDVVSQRTDVLGHLGGLLGGCITAFLLESRIAGPLQGERDRLPLPAALLAVVALLAYGGYGVLSTLPSETALLQAGRTTSRSVEIGLLKRAVERRPWFSEAREYLILLLLRQGRTAEAAEQYRQALQENRGSLKGVQDASIREILGDYYQTQASRAYNRKQWQEALQEYRALLALDVSPTYNAVAHNGIAWTLADNLEQDLPEAEKHAQEAVRLQPGAAGIIDTLAWVYYKQGRLQEALDTQTRAVNLARTDPLVPPDQRAELYYHLGAIQEKLNHVGEARDAYNKALENNPRYPEAREGLKRMESRPVEPAPAGSGLGVASAGGGQAHLV
ncbi:MAG TPA: rhomboid family intramembrane serine protease [Armatimonadota bacterium]|nr:rhomboid family intramembrane serine protease [Armatimonadota bacterium]